jgi:PEP-CTERM motif
MVMRVRHVLFAGLVILTAARTAGASLITINFDDLPAVNDNSQSGAAYSSLGVFINTLNSIPNTVDSAGDAFVASFLSDTFWLISNDNSISPPNFAAATNGGPNEVLIFFATPVTSVDLQTDDAPGENPDVVRLLAVERLAGFNFQVLAADSGLDNAVMAPDNSLHVDLGGTPFSYALFQTTTEQEGFDNLQFNQVGEVPEPASLVLVGSGLVALVRRRRERR